MQGIVIKLRTFRQLHDLAQVHHGHAITDVAHHRQVMGNEQIGEAKLGLQIFQQVDNLRLNRNVQGRDRLVADDELRIDGQGAGHADALALAAREFVWIAVDEIRVETDDLQQLRHALATALLVAHIVHVQRLTHDVAHGHTGIQRRVGVLEDHLHLTALMAQFFTLHGGEVLVLEEDVAGRGVIELQDRAPGRGFSTTAFAHQAQRLPTFDAKT